MIVRVVAVMTSLVLAATLGPPAAAAPGDWDDLGLTHSDWYRIHYRGNSMAQPGYVEAIAVTADSALVTDGYLIDGSLRSRHNRLLELPAGSGEPRVIGRRVVGVPMADPAGHRVFWSALDREGDQRLHAYDTAMGTSYRGPADDLSVWVVDGDTAYVTGDRGGWTWTPGAGDPGLTEMAPPLPEDAFLADVAGENRAIATEDDAYVVAPDGTVLASGLPGWPQFGPTGEYLSLLRNRGVDLWDLAAGRRVTLTGLGGRRAFSPRWSPGGDLVVSAYLRRNHQPGPYADWDDARPVTYFRCTVPDGRCVELRPENRHPVGLDPWTFEPNALDQFAVMVGS